MLKEKKFWIVFILENVLPWIAGVLGFIAISYFNKEGELYRAGLKEQAAAAGKLFTRFYNSAFGTGGVVLGCLFVIAVVCIVLIIIELINKTQDKNSIIRLVILWVWSIPCSIGTVLFILMTGIFTYGMSV